MRGVLSIWVTCALVLASAPREGAFTTVTGPTSSATATTGAASSTTGIASTTTGTAPTTTGTASTTTGTAPTTTGTASTTTGAAPTTTGTASTTTGTASTTTGAASTTTGTAPTTIGATTESTTPAGSTHSTTESTASTTTPIIAPGTPTTGPALNGTTANVTTVSPGTHNTTSSDITGATSETNVTGPTQNATEPTTSPSTTTTTSPPGTCSPSLCGTARCLQLSKDYVCLCPLGFAFDVLNLSCRPGDAFYGELQISGRELNADPTTESYTAVYRDVLNNMTECFRTNPNYLGTSILELRQSSAKSARSTGPVIVNMANTFGTGTVTEATVSEAIKNYIATIDNIGTYTNQTICSFGAFCDLATTTCAEYNNGQSAVCTCKSGLFSSQTTITTCRECESNCTAADGQQCKQEGADNTPKCVCLPGYKTTNDKCTKCGFGYSGEECKDDYLLILVIVGAVLGAAVLSLLGAVIGVSVRSKKGKSAERIELIDDDKLEGSSTAPGSLFPKVQIKTDVGHVNRASKVYEDDEQYSRNIPKRDYDENPWYEMDRKDRNY